MTIPSDLFAWYAVTAEPNPPMQRTPSAPLMRKPLGNAKG